MSFLTRHVWTVAAAVTAAGCALFAIIFYPRGIDYEAQLAHAAARYDAYVLLDDGITAQTQGDLATAREKYEASLAIDEDLYRAQLMMGELELREGNVEEAIARFDTALALWEHQADALNSRAVAKWRNGDERGALRDLQRALRLNPNFLRAQTNRALIRLAAGDREEAQSELTATIEGIEKLTRVPRAVMGLGILHALEGRYDEAIDSFSLLVDLPGRYGRDALYNRAHAYDAMGNTAAAEQDRAAYEQRLLANESDDELEDDPA